MITNPPKKEASGTQAAMPLNHRIFVGAFHKTGTVLLAGIFRSLARKLDLVFWPVYEGSQKIKRGAQIPPPEFHWDICFDGHSRFLTSKRLFDAASLGLISMRDPRDVVISAARYHCTSSEPWLHVPRPQFGGKTYQETICALPDDDARFLFEMEHRGRQTIEGMLSVDLTDARLFITRLEALMTDVDLSEYSRIFSFLGFKGSELQVCLDVARNRSIFAGKATRKGHVQHGRASVWKECFTPDIAAEFENCFPGVAERLGYEPTFAKADAAQT